MANAQLHPGQFYGEVLGKFRGQEVILSELRHTTGRRLPRHTHELAYFSLLLGGNYSEQLGEKTVNYNPMSIMFHPPNTTHIDEIGDAGGHFFSVEIQQRWLDRLREHCKPRELPSDLRHGELVWLATRLYREFKNLDAFSSLAIEGLVLEMLSVAGRINARREKRAPAWLSRVVEMLHAEFHSRLTLENISASIGIHPLHLSKVFRQFHNQSISDYVNQLRIQFCYQQLSRGDEDLATIAMSAGFSDQSHFTRTFKKLTGLTPGAVRKLKR